jgi:hypothetical protein
MANRYRNFLYDRQAGLVLVDLPLLLPDIYGKLAPGVYHLSIRLDVYAKPPSRDDAAAKTLESVADFEVR